jgi:hypothetical protein
MNGAAMDLRLSIILMRRPDITSPRSYSRNHSPSYVSAFSRQKVVGSANNLDIRSGEQLCVS